MGGDAVAACDRAESGIVRQHIPVADGGIPSSANFADATRFIADTLRDPDARMYVHCRLGRERTGAVLAAYYAVANDMTAQEAVDELNAQGAILAPNAAQMMATRQWVAHERSR